MIDIFHNKKSKICSKTNCPPNMLNKLEDVITTPCENALLWNGGWGMVWMIIPFMGAEITGKWSTTLNGHWKSKIQFWVW